LLHGEWADLAGALASAGVDLEGMLLVGYLEDDETGSESGLLRSTGSSVWVEFEVSNLGAVQLTYLGGPNLARWVAATLYVSRR